MRVCKRFSFDAAHYLPGYEGKCKNMHGHHWVLEVEVEGEVEKDGMVVDFGVLKEIVGTAVVNVLDHHLLNDVVALPTCENLLLWVAQVWRQSRPAVALLSQGVYLTRIRLYEAPDSFAELRFSGGQTLLEALDEELAGVKAV